MKILGTGSAVPQLEVSNDMLSQMMDTNDEWIRTRTGIRSRRVLSSETLTDIAVLAAKRSIEQSGVAISDIDYILCHNIINNAIIPSLASIIARELNAKCPTLDLNSACTGFLYSLDMAEALIKCGKAKKILIVCAEQASHFVDWTKRETCVLFGDAAGSVVVGEGGEDYVVQLGTQWTDALYAPCSANKTPFQEIGSNEPYLYMRGRDVFKMAVLNSIADIRKVVEKSEFQMGDVKYFLLHQANIRILDVIKKDLQLSEESLPHNIEKYGNTSSASVPLLMDEMNREGKFKEGDVIVLSAFGAGFTSGAVLLKW